MPGTPREAFYLRFTMAHNKDAKLNRETVILPYVPLTRSEHNQYLSAIKACGNTLTLGEFTALYSGKAWLEMLCDDIHKYDRYRFHRVILDRIRKGKEPARGD